MKCPTDGRPLAAGRSGAGSTLLECPKCGRTYVPATDRQTGRRNGRLEPVCDLCGETDCVGADGVTPCPLS